LSLYPTYHIKPASIYESSSMQRMDGCEESGRNRIIRVSRGAGKEAKTQTEKPARAEELLLRDIAEDRSSSTTERYMRLGLNAYQGNKARESLILKGLIEVKDIPTRTGRVRLLELTEKGREEARALGLKAGDSCRKGGPDHEYMKGRIAREYRLRGYQVIEEYPLGKGKATDLVAVKDGKRIAIEVETGKSDAIYNVRKNLEAGFSKVLCVVPNERLKDKIDGQLAGLRLDKGKVLVILAG
jgi:DNA-binding MarR family transcriptional regulator